MPYWKKTFNKSKRVYYPSAILQGKPIESEVIARTLSKISTVSNADFQAVLADIAGVINMYMAMGRSVHLRGLGYFFFRIKSKGVKNFHDFNFDEQYQGVKVQFIPDKEYLPEIRRYQRALADSAELDWIELPSDLDGTESLEP